MDKIEVIRKCLLDLTFFGKIISPSTYYLKSPEFHKELDEIFLDKKTKQCSIEAPRGTAKSSKTVSKVMHHITFEEGDKLVVIQSKTRPEAINRLTKVKNILEYSQEYKDLFGYAGEQIAEMWREDKIRTKINGWWVTVKAIGTGQPVRGALENDTRITLYLLDDADDELNTITKEQMDKNFDYFLGGLAGLDMRNGRVIVIGTPIRQGCIVDRLRDASGWVTKRYQAYWEEDGKLKLLWGEMYSYEWLLNKKKELEELGKISKFYSEYMCEIVGDEDRLFKKEYLRWYEGETFRKDNNSFLSITHEGNTEHTLIELPEPKILPVTINLGIDPASSTKQTADYSVTFPICWSGKDIFCLEYFRRRVHPTSHAEQIISKIKELQPDHGKVETVGYQEMLRDYLRKRLDEDGLWLSGLETKNNPRTEKSARLERLHPYFFNRKVWVKPSMTEFVDELLMYPRSRHDDLMDGFDLATRKLINPEHEIEIKKEVSNRDFFNIGINRKPSNWTR